MQGHVEEVGGLPKDASEYIHISKIVCESLGKSTN